MMQDRPVIGIDIGGTAIKGVAFGYDGKVLAEETRATDDVGDATWRSHALELVRVLRARVPEAQAVGICAPGLAARDERSIVAMPGRLQGLVGMNWGDYLGLRTCVLNDGHAALLGEVWQGAARGSKNVLMLTLGTGLGGGALAEGRLLRGHRGRAGHFGHLSMDPDGPADIVGIPGSLEDAIGECTIAARSGGRFATTRDLLKAMREGDVPARGVWNRSVRVLAVALAGLVNALDPEIVVIGGGISGAGDDLFGPLRLHFAEMEWQIDSARVPILPALLGSRAGAYGAAFRAREIFFSP